MSKDFSVRRCELSKLNTMTKYPSIPTYHMLGDKGILLEEAIAFDDEVILTEKVDGTNSRIILLPDGNFILGSREELLFARGDLIGNPAQGIVDALKDVANLLPQSQENITVAYLEVYGGKITGASKQYTSQQKVGWRLFDVAILTEIETLFSQSVQELAVWRDKNGSSFLSEEKLSEVAKAYNLDLTPRLGKVSALPTDIKETHEFLKGAIPKTNVALDEGAGSQPEGIIARTASRSIIAKLRFEDYERHSKRHK